jgi:hypothetical protein
MVKVVILVLLCATLCAVRTFITPFGHTSKRILKRIDVGEGRAMKPEREVKLLRKLKRRMLWQEA